MPHGEIHHLSQGEAFCWHGCFEVTHSHPCFVSKFNKTTGSPVWLLTEWYFGLSVIVQSLREQVFVSISPGRVYTTENASVTSPWPRSLHLQVVTWG